MTTPTIEERLNCSINEKCQFLELVEIHYICFNKSCGSSEIMQNIETSEFLNPYRLLKRLL